MTGEPGLHAAAAALRSALAELDIPAMIIGGIAVIAHGVPRQTVDIDATVWGAELDLDRTLEIFKRRGIEPRIKDAKDFARQRQVLLLRHAGTGTPIDLSLAWLPFEQEALEKAQEIDFGGIRLRVAQPEDLIILKAVAWRDRDRSDIERLLLLHSRSIDLGRIRRTVTEFAEVLGESRRLGELEELIQRIEQQKASPDTI